MKFLKLIFSRMVIVGLLILLQAAILVFITLELSNYFIYAYITFMIISVLIVMYIINKDDSPSFKLPWIILILVFPILGGLFYLMFGDNKMNKRFIKIAKKLEYKTKDLYIQDSNIKNKLLQENKYMYTQSNYIYNTSKMPVYENTISTYFPIGEKMYERLLQELENAKHFIFLEYFIIQEGKMWNSILEILKRKVKQGLDVRVMYDDIGCVQLLPYNYNKHLEKMGIKCVVFNPFVPVLSIGHNNRDHRKIAVIDGYIAFTGGINLADEYINEIEKHGHWKDVAIILEGEAVKNFTLMFLESWNYYRNEDKDYNNFMPHIHHKENFKSDGFYQPYGDTPLDKENVGETVYTNIINTANDYVFINTPYLIIDYELFSALTQACKKGVDVRIITPHVPDKWFVHYTTQSYYLSLIRAGVKIYEYKPGFNHAKTFVSDDIVGVVGSINLDYRSLFHHFECGVWMYNTPSLLQIKDDFLKTIDSCIEVTEKFCKSIPWYKRLCQSFLKFFAPLM